MQQGGGERCFMLLCQVALGHSQKVDRYQVGVDDQFGFNEYQSRIARGLQIPDPRYTITRNYGWFRLRLLLNYVRIWNILGVHMPLGQLIACRDSTDAYRRRTYNEYIVFDESQVAIRYLVQFQR